MAKIDFMAQAEAMREELVARRRDFHQHPELAFEEVRTAGIVAETLNELGLEVQTGIGKTGVVGILEGDSDGPTVLVRADMDALPIEEANQTDYISQTPGKMHACGHDGHTTIGLGVAKLLSQHRDKIAGRIKFVFQPAEEIGQGARAMVTDGVMTNPKVDVSLGLHLWNSLPVGKVGVAEGPVMSAPSMFEITIKGKGGHGAMPNQTADPVVCAAQMIMAFQTIVSRNTDPLEQAVVSVATVKAGTARNVIPDSATLAGTIRTFSVATRDIIDTRMREIAEHTAAAMNCEAIVNLMHGGDAVVNHPEATQRVRAAFKKAGMSEENFLDERTMGSEDVGIFMTDVPGMYFFLGSSNDEKGLNYAHHHPRFDFDEDALPMGVALLSAAIAEYIIPE